MYKRGYTLWVFRIGKTFEQAIGGAQYWKSHFRLVDEGREALVMTFAGFTEEHGLNAATGTKSFLDEADALDTDEAVFCGQAAAQG